MSTDNFSDNQTLKLENSKLKIGWVGTRPSQDVDIFVVLDPKIPATLRTGTRTSKIQDGRDFDVPRVPSWDVLPQLFVLEFLYLYQSLESSYQ